MQILNDLKRVLIDGEAMQRIAHGERIDATQLRQKHRKQMQRVHGAQSFRRVRIWKYVLEKSPEIVTLWQMCGQQRPCLVQLMFRRWTEFETVMRDQENRPEKYLGVSDILW